MLASIIFNGDRGELTDYSDAHKDNIEARAEVGSGTGHPGSNAVEDRVEASPSATADCGTRPLDSEQWSLLGMLFWPLYV